MFSESLSSKMAPFVWKYIERLLQKSENIGTCAGVTRIISEASGLGRDKPCDRFLITFPYGAQCCKWEVIFNSSQPKEPPDFIFHNNDQNFFPVIDELRSLYEWDHADPDSLYLVVRDLVSAYKIHHNKLIAGTRVEFELFSLIRCEDEAPPPVVVVGDGLNGGPGHERCSHFPHSEVFVTSKASGNLGPIQIGVKLPINLAQLSDTNSLESSMDKVLAIVTYENVDGGNITTQICPSSRIERALRSVGGIPHVPFPLEGCLHDYVTSVTNQINDMIDRLTKSFEKRKQFVLSLTSAFSSFLLEYDSTSFSHVYLIISTETSSTLKLTVEVPPNFPTVQPTLQFSSTTKDSTTKSIKDYPYSPRWSAKEMTERLKMYLLTNVTSISKDLHGNKSTPLKT